MTLILTKLADNCRLIVQETSQGCYPPKFPLGIGLVNARLFNNLIYRENLRAIVMASICAVTLIGDSEGIGRAR
jgi:hypothetical protein